MKHNPAFLSPEQVGVSERWRLLDVDEVVSDFPSDAECCQAWSDNTSNWGADVYSGCCVHITYRTHLSRAELREARGLPPEETDDILSKGRAYITNTQQTIDGLRSQLASKDREIAVLEKIVKDREQERDKALDLAKRSQEATTISRNQLAIERMETECTSCHKMTTNPVCEVLGYVCIRCILDERDDLNKSLARLTLQLEAVVTAAIEMQRIANEK